MTYKQPGQRAAHAPDGRACHNVRLYLMFFMLSVSSQIDKSWAVPVNRGILLCVPYVEYCRTDPLYGSIAGRTGWERGKFQNAGTARGGDRCLGLLLHAVG